MRALLDTFVSRPASMRPVAGISDVAGDTLSSATNARTGLVRDDRGVIMVIGIFFTFLWVGLAWAVWGIGNAIAYRENLQNAADASAFAAAVYDARGMNLLASINILMGVVLAVLIVMHIVQLVYFLVQVADCAQCIPQLSCLYGWEDCPNDCSNEASMNGDVKDVDDAIHDILPILHDLEVGIAVGWPWVASGKSTTLGPPAYYKNGVALTSSFAYSQIPWSADTELSKLTGGFINFGGATSDGNSDNTRYGLPVMSDKYSNLCMASAVELANFGGLVQMPSFLGSAIASFVGDTMGDWFCDAGSDSHTPTEALEVLSSVMLPCTLYGPGSPIPSVPMSSNNQDSLSGKRISNGDHDESPMTLYSDAKMGYDYFGIWSTAIGTYTTDRDTKKIRVAALESKSGAPTVADVPSDAQLGVAKSEFYYDPMTGDSKGAEEKIGSDWPIRATMWNLRWRARLRRYHYFPGLVGDLDALMGANIEQALKTAAATGINDLLHGESPESILKSLTDEGTSVDSYKNKPTEDIFH